MKNKRLTYVLLPGAVAIWAIVIFRILSAVGSNENEQQFSTTTAHVQIENHVRDSFELNLNYRDPFLGNIPKPLVKTKPTTSKPTKKRSQPKTIRWPNVSYHGIIRNEKSGEELAILKIEGREYLMKSGMSENDVLVSGFSAQQIELQYGGEHKTFEKL